jgi:alanine racemase
MLASDHLRLEGVFTHFASADEPESPVFNTQRERFDRAYEIVSEILPAEAGSREQSQSVASALTARSLGKGG